MTEPKPWFHREEFLRDVLQAVEDVLMDDNSTYGERCDLALELIKKSGASGFSSHELGGARE